MSESLKPCLHCGGKACLENTYYGYQIWCTECHIATTTYKPKTASEEAENYEKQTAITIWNRRAAGGEGGAEVSGKRYQSGYDDGFKAGEWAGRRAPNPLLPLVRELRDAIAALLTMMDRGVSPRKLDETLTWVANDRKARAMGQAGIKNADKALAGEPGDGGEQRREDFVAGVVWACSPVRGETEAEAEALRRYPEKPQEGKA